MEQIDWTATADQRAARYEAPSIRGLDKETMDKWHRVFMYLNRNPDVSERAACMRVGVPLEVYLAGKAKAVASSGEAFSCDVRKYEKIPRQPSAVAKLNEQKVREIRSLSAGGHSNADIAKYMGVDAATVRSVVNRFTWRHVV